jgi:excisionase family DNA binding protein
MPTHAETPERRLMSLQEARDLLGLSRTTVYRLVRDGELPVVEFPGRTLVQASDLDAFIESRKTRRSPNERSPASRPDSAITPAVPGDGYDSA